MASPSMRAISSGMLDIKVDVFKTDELDGRVDGVRAREQQRSERGKWVTNVQKKTGTLKWVKSQRTGLATYLPT